MTEENKIEDVERVEIAPSGGENVEPESEEVEEESVEPQGERQPREKLIVHQKPEEPTGGETESKPVVGNGTGDGLEDVEGETPRERALRAKLARLEKDDRDRRGAELGLGQGSSNSDKKELPAEKKAVLEKYKPEEIQSLREVLPVLAEEMGYVRADQLSAQQYSEQSQDILDEFLKDHPEYTPEKDKDGILWGRFKEEFGIYNKPQNPKDYRKIFNRIHTDIFGIKPVGDKGAITAAQRKINVASHAGASGPNRPAVAPRRTTNTNGLRVDMLKGFSDEEKAAMLGDQD